MHESHYRTPVGSLIPHSHEDGKLGIRHSHEGRKLVATRFTPVPHIREDDSGTSLKLYYLS